MNYVYVLCDSRKPGFWSYPDGLGFDYKPFYVGQTNNLSRRVLEHYNIKRDALMNRRLQRSVQDAGLVVEVIWTADTQKEACSVERDTKKIGRRDKGEGPLLNKASGGQAPNLEKLSKASKAQWERAKQHESVLKERMRPLEAGLVKYYELLGKEGRSARGQAIADKRIKNGTEVLRIERLTNTKRQVSLANYRKALSVFDHFRPHDYEDVVNFGSGTKILHVCRYHGKFLSRDAVTTCIRKFNEPCRRCRLENS